MQFESESNQTIETLDFLGHGMSRPESVLTTKNGDVFASHKSRGIVRICPDGKQYYLAEHTLHEGVPIVPNGIALMRDGSFLLANISDAGGLLKLDRNGVSLFHACSSGGTAPPVNYVCVDPFGRVWFTVSSTLSPRSLAYRRDVMNGYVGFIEDGEMHIVLEGLHYTNEICLDFERGWLYVAETFAQKISRVPLTREGVAGEKEDFVLLPKGAFVDGIELDGEGGLIAACIVSNELFRISPDGNIATVLSERDTQWVAEVERALDKEVMGRPHFDTAPTKMLRNVSSSAFLGEKLDRLVCGNLLGDRLPVLKAPVKGRAPVHWHVHVPLWGEAF
ncbi:Gluconolactonase [Roseibium album]|nr:Gluconolactonase [Roseibium album]